jgi:hypothetical protein
MWTERGECSQHIAWFDCLRWSRQGLWLVGLCFRECGALRMHEQQQLAVPCGYMSRTSWWLLKCARQRACRTSALTLYWKEGPFMWMARGECSQHVAHS